MTSRVLRGLALLAAWAAAIATVPVAAELFGRDALAILLATVTLSGWLGGRWVGLAAGIAGVAACAWLLPACGPLDRALALTFGPLVGYLRWLRLDGRLHRDAHRASRIDPLTGLLRRTAFLEELGALLARERGGERLIAVLFVDLDRFKTLNDAYGHAFGDHVLRAVARCLQDNVRAADLVGRLGGDEFVLAMPGLRDHSAAAELASKITALLNAPFEIAGRVVHVGASVGISVAPDDGADAETLLRHADAAMYEVKHSGHKSCVFSTDVLRTRHSRRLELERRLRGALEGGELELHYQPQVRLADGRTSGHEALLRWHNGTLGTVKPEEFVPLAEEAGMIVELGTWVLWEACRQAAAWREEGRAWTVSVNVSALQFAQPDFADGVRRALEAHGLPGEAIELELTESLLLRDIANARSVLAELERCGVQALLDDFGTGYASLTYLQRLPLRTLKIDRSFVTELGRGADDEAGAAIVEAVVAMAHKLGKEVVAEGIETRAQLDFLRRVGCHYGQGFLFARPLPAPEATRRPPGEAGPRPEGTTLLLAANESPG